MLKNIFLPLLITAATFISTNAINHTNTITTTTIIEHHIETKTIEPSLAQKIRAFVVDNKPIFVGAFIISIIALYPQRAPVFIEWMLIHLTAQMLGNKTNTHLLFHFR